MSNEQWAIEENAIKNNVNNTADKPESRPPPALTFYYLDDITEILDYFKETIEGVKHGKVRTNS